MKAPRSLGAFGITMFLSLFGASCLVKQCAPPPVSAPIDISAPCADLVNAARSSAGLAPLAVNGPLNVAAELHSTDQAQREDMTHAGSNGSDAGVRIERQGYSWSTWAENVAAGQPDCPAVVDAWMHSAGHRANILDPSLTDIGVGAVTGSNGVVYWTMDFAAAA